MRTEFQCNESPSSEDEVSGVVSGGCLILCERADWPQSSELHFVGSNGEKYPINLRPHDTGGG